VSDIPKRITLEEWDLRYEKLQKAGTHQPDYGGPLSRHVEDGGWRPAAVEASVRQFRCGFEAVELFANRRRPPAPGQD